MYNFGTRSRRELFTLKRPLQQVLIVVVRYIDFAILQGKRGRAEQSEAVATGRSQLEWPESTHNCAIEELHKDRALWREDPQGLSAGVDVSPWPIIWTDERQYCVLAGHIIREGINQGVKIRWGGDWDQNGQGNWRKPGRQFNDLGHFEQVG